MVGPVGTLQTVMVHTRPKTRFPVMPPGFLDCQQSMRWCAQLVGAAMRFGVRWPRRHACLSTLSYIHAFTCKDRFFGVPRHALMRAGLQDAHAYKYTNVRRWTMPKRLANYGQASSCLLECDRLVVPVHCGQTHWACAMVDLQGRQLFYFDSLHVRGRGS